MCSLLQSFKEKLLEDNAVISGESCTSQKLKNRLVSHCHNHISLLKQCIVNTPELPIKSDIDLKDVINVAFRYKEMLRNLKICYDNNKGALTFDKSVTLYHAAAILHSNINEAVGILFRPLNPVKSVKNAVKPSFQMTSIIFLIGPFALNFRKVQFL